MPPVGVNPTPLALGPEVPVWFTLGQAWRAEPEALLRATRVAVTFRTGALHVEADLDDTDVWSAATAHNQRTWELGDVFEIFARRADEAGYVEVHVTPDNVKLHLRFDDHEQHRRIDGIAAVARDPAAIESSARRTATGWRATAVVPLAARAGDVIFVSFCRYDATRGKPEPVLSSSSPHPVLAFHRPWEWTPCRIVD